MGVNSSALEKECQREADRIRDELHLRIDQFRRRYQEQFIDIPPQTKKLIKGSTALQLTELMNQGKITSYQIMLTFIERTSTIAVRNGYVIGQMFNQAVQNAKECDRIRKEEPHKKCWRWGNNKEDTFPPFYGVPISLKDNILYPGTVSYIGHAYPINPIPEQPSQFILLIKAMGFIPFVKTSTPQANKTIQTNNNILGYCKNPWNEQRSCGGSSGGEGGIIASHCSPIGIGNDIAGSSRIPSEFNGLVTLKPYYRYSNLCTASSGSFSGGLFLRPQVTVMSRSIEDVILWNQFMYSKQFYSDIPRKLKDPYLRLTPFRQKVFTQQKKYKIGYFTDFKGEIKCSPSHRRAVHEALLAAQEYGHYTQEIEIKDAQKMMLMLLRIWFGNPDLQILNELKKGQKSIPQYRQVYELAKIPAWAKKVIMSVLSLTQPRLAALVGCSSPYTLKDLFFMVHELQQIRKHLYQYLTSKEIDLIICPGYFMPAFKLGQANKFSYCPTFVSIWSILFYAAGSLPITVVKQDEQYFQDFFKDQIAKDANQSMKGAQGLPVGIQVVSYPGHQQQVLLLMKQIEEKIKFSEKFRSKSFDLVE